MRPLLQKENSAAAGCTWPTHSDGAGKCGATEPKSTEQGSHKTEITECLLIALQKDKPIARAALVLFSFLLRQCRSPALFFDCRAQSPEYERNLTRFYKGMARVIQITSNSNPFSFVNIACAHALHVLLSCSHTHSAVPSHFTARMQKLHEAAAQTGLTREMLCHRLDGQTIPTEGDPCLLVSLCSRCDTFSLRDRLCKDTTVMTSLSCIIATYARNLIARLFA